MNRRSFMRALPAVAVAPLTVCAVESTPEPRPQPETVRPGQIWSLGDVDCNGEPVLHIVRDCYTFPHQDTSRCYLWPMCHAGDGFSQHHDTRQANLLANPLWRYIGDISEFWDRLPEKE